MSTLNGSSNEISLLEGTLTEMGSLIGSLSLPTTSIYQKYMGSYTVTPAAHHQQVLKTSGLVMSDDVTVLEIPYFETSNISGTTIYIGSEV